MDLYFCGEHEQGARKRDATRCLKKGHRPSVCKEPNLVATSAKKKKHTLGAGAQKKSNSALPKNE